MSVGIEEDARATADAVDVPSYLLEHDDPSALFSRLQRLVIHLELLQREAMVDLDISFNDFVILATLRKEPPPHSLPVSRIATFVLRPMGSISQAVDRVEQAGLVQRAHAQDDRRMVLVSLTDAGKKFADEALDAYDDTRRRVFKRLSFDDLDQIDTAVTTLVAALDADHREQAT